MRIIISPAKKMNADTDGLAPVALPRFLHETQQLKDKLQSMAAQELQALWGCNSSIARLNVERLQNMDLHHNLTPAILSYEGIQYRYMAPNVFETAQFDYIREHLRILSGFYGLLSPFDGVTPYRLEMQARLAVGGCKNLYSFWGGKPAACLAEESGLILNLASKEYSEAVRPYLPDTVCFLTCTFGERKNGKVVEKGTMCKMARGQMVRWLGENQIISPADMREFRELEYRFSPADSTEEHFVFVRENSQARIK